MKYIPNLTRHLLSLEKDVQNGKMFAEHEHEFYILFKDFDFLKKASSMDMQEQWGIKVQKSLKNDCKGSVRIRQIQAGSVVSGADQTSQKPKQYVLTVKADLKSGVRDEVPIPTTKDAFEIFAKISDGGMIKHRYHFPVDGLVFEVDMFLNPEGGYYEWAKVDLEVKNKEMNIPPFPFTFEKMIRGDSESLDDRDLIHSLYEKYFITPNKYIAQPMTGDDTTDRRMGIHDPGDHEYR